MLILQLLSVRSTNKFRNWSVLASQLQTALLTNRPASIPAIIYENVNQLVATVSSVHNQLSTLEEERNSLQALARIGSLVNSSLEVDEVLQVVMDTIVRLTGAERGFLMLKDGQERARHAHRPQLGTRIDRSFRVCYQPYGHRPRSR